jgi:NYN domain
MDSIKTLETKAQMNIVPGNFPTLRVIRGGLFSVAPREHNWAFIDMQNLFKGVKEQGGKIDWKRFRIFLKDNYCVEKAVLFMGYIPQNEWLYQKLYKAGFEIEFRVVKQINNGKIDGGNIDADLTGYMMDNKREYTQALVIADDGDYRNTILSLKKQNKLKLIISSHTLKNTAKFIRDAVGDSMIVSIHSLRNIISYPASGNNI